MANERHGIKACVMLNTTGTYAKLAVASGFSVGETGSECEVLRLEDTCISRKRGAIDSAGTVTAYHDQDGKILQSMAQAQMAYPMLIYPDCTDVTTYYQVSALFDYDHAGDAGSCQTLTAPWRAEDCLAKVGFS